MSLIKWTPFLDPFDEMDKFMKEHFHLAPQGGFLPAIDMYQTKNSVVVEVALPKFDPKDIKITVENDVLVLEGKTSNKREVEEKNYYRKEMRFGSFYRSIALPGHVAGEKAKATYEDGVLKIEIPKLLTKKQKVVKVEVKKSKKSEKK